MNEKIEQMLQNSELFMGLSQPYRDIILKKGKTQKLKSGEIIFLEGERGFFCYLLIDGAVKLFKSGSEGKEIIIKLVKPGEVFAEVVIFESSHYPVSSIAVTESTIFLIGRDLFHELLENENFRDEYISLLMKKQRYLTQRILYLTAYDVEERFFLFIAERFGKKQMYDINISKKECASAIGTIPETLSRLIQRLTKRNIIEWNGTILKISEGFWDDYSPEL